MGGKMNKYFCRLEFTEYGNCITQCDTCNKQETKYKQSEYYKSNKNCKMENENILLNDTQKQTPTKFKLNIVGVYFVGSAVCVIWKIYDLLTYLIEKIL